jgi:hypothetical protein
MRDFGSTNLMLKNNYYQRMLCWLGFHDWECLVQQSTIDIENYFFGINGVDFHNSHNLYKRVCMKCGKSEDTIKDYMDYCESTKDARFKRRELARKMFEENKENNDKG